MRKKDTKIIMCLGGRHCGKHFIYSVIDYLKKENEILEEALKLACETITEEGCDNCEFRFNCKKYYGGSTLEDCKNTFIEQAKENIK